MNITAAVGAWEKAARNLRPDVACVQRLLTDAAMRLGRPELDPGGIDGLILRPPRVSTTVKAIRAFQVLSGISVDGRVDPGGRTWQHLVGAVASPVADSATGTACFPFALAAVADWLHAPRSFGARRSGGRRAHAGCDLYAPVGRAIHAVKAGTVLRDPYDFYAETDALEIDHGDFILRYGEIQPGCTLRRGDQVTGGQIIARVGRLVGIDVPSAMLHLEMYAGTAEGPLSVREPAMSARSPDGVPFMRRRDLMDPTPYLNAWRTRLAVP